MTDTPQRPREFWIHNLDNNKALAVWHVEPASGPDVVHVIEKSAYDQVVRERDDANAAVKYERSRAQAWQERAEAAESKADSSNYRNTVSALNAIGKERDDLAAQLAETKADFDHCYTAYQDLGRLWAEDGEKIERLEKDLEMQKEISDLFKSESTSSAELVVKMAEIITNLRKQLAEMQAAKDLMVDKVNELADIRVINGGEIILIPKNQERIEQLELALEQYIGIGADIP